MGKANDILIANGACGENLTWELDKSGTLTISGTGDMDNYDFFLAKPWSGVRKSITSIIIRYGVTSIGSYAFCGCESLTNITISDSVTDVGGGAFEDCSSLQCNTCDSANYLGNENNPYFVLVSVLSTNITNCDIHPDTKVICGSAFYNCSNLTSVTIPNGVTGIGSAAFLNCSHLTSIIIPESVTSIDALAFHGCGSLTSITIPGGVSSIGAGAFENCSSLTSISIPDSVTYIDDDTFKHCKNLKSIVLPESLQHIGSAAFSECKQLENLQLPNNLRSIGGFAFSKCDSLTSLTIPDSVTGIGDHAFDSCSSLTSITISNSITSIGDSAFYACRELKNIAIPERITKIGISTFCQCTKLQTVTLPECLTEIGALCFGGCKCLTNILIPNTVTDIGERAFISCTALRAVTLPVGLECIGDKAFFNCNSKLLIRCSKKIFGMLNKENKDALAKLWMTGNAEFQQDQVDAIEKYVSRARNRLFLEIDGDDGEALVKLLDCGKLTPEVIKTYIKKCNDGQHPQMMAVLLNYQNENVSFEIREELIAKELGFAEREAKDWAKIYRWQTEDDGITITKYKGIDSEVDIPDQIDGISVVRIGKNAFKKNEQLKKVNIPNTIIEIMESAFEQCINLSEVEWSENLTLVGKRAFYYCSMLSGTLSLPQSVKSLGISAFAGCDYSAFDLPEGLEYIESYALACRDIVDLHIPSTVKKMAGCIGCSTGDLYIHGMKTKIPTNYFQGMPLTIHAYAGSYAAKCAEKGAFETFVLIEDLP